MAVFHYAGGPISAAILGVDDIFTRGAVAWRRKEYKRLLLPGVIRDPASVEEADERD